MALDDTLRVLRAFPPILRTRLTELPPSSFLRRPSNGTFSLLEHVCHLRDYELEGVQGRADRILGEDKPFLPDFDGDRDYRAETSGRETLETFAVARERTVALFSRLTEAERNRPATLGTRGDITLVGLCDVVAEHDATHLAEIESLLAELR